MRRGPGWSSGGWLFCQGMSYVSSSAAVVEARSTTTRGERERARGRACGLCVAVAIREDSFAAIAALTYPCAIALPSRLQAFCDFLLPTVSFFWGVGVGDRGGRRTSWVQPECIPCRTEALNCVPCGRSSVLLVEQKWLPRCFESSAQTDSASLRNGWLAGWRRDFVFAGLVLGDLKTGTRERNYLASSTWSFVLNKS